jgi:uncharacterized repeat protein (TIGR03803 family)
MRTTALIVLTLGLVWAASAFASNEKVLHNFIGGTDGSYPVAGVIADRAGNLYGTTRFGGTDGLGTVFKIARSGLTESVIYSFAGGNDGNSPYGGLVMDKAGNIYGTTRFGRPANAGVVFELSPSGNTWQEQVLYSFTGGNDGGSP